MAWWALRASVKSFTMTVITSFAVPLKTSRPSSRKRECSPYLCQEICIPHKPGGVVGESAEIKKVVVKVKDYLIASKFEG